MQASAPARRTSKRTLSKAEALTTVRDLEKRIPCNAERIRELASRDTVQARHLLQQITGTIRLVEPKGENALRAEYDYGIDHLLGDAKSLKSNAQVYVVAGAESFAHVSPHEYRNF